MDIFLFENNNLLGKKLRKFCIIFFEIFTQKDKDYQLSHHLTIQSNIQLNET